MDVTAKKQYLLFQVSMEVIFLEEAHLELYSQQEYLEIIEIIARCFLRRRGKPTFANQDCYFQLFQEEINYFHSYDLVSSNSYSIMELWIFDH